jgi:hypothetical protein
MLCITEGRVICPFDVTVAIAEVVVTNDMASSLYRRIPYNSMRLAHCKLSH